MSSIQSSYMQMAIDEAQKGVDLGDGGPFGACIVKEGRVISLGHNTVIASHDPTAHAEMNAIRQACSLLGTHDLSGTEIYTTSEPCPMCLAALYWSRVSAIYVGVSRTVAAEFGFDDAFFYQELSQPEEARAVKQRTGCLEAPIRNLFSRWQGQNRPLY
ncbi:MAG: cytidine/deoxycytidylate deaminase family protein [Chlamydiales bacterium]|jgi:tRNA(Arg) A34 adenosine deaminase TadA|nr:cytidine/deoxycytidylate deaminase family protein [Chlamydiales bacterium]